MKLIIVPAMFNTSDYMARPLGLGLLDFFVSEGFEPIVYSPPGYSSQELCELSFSEIVCDFDQFVARKVGPDEIVAFFGHSVGGVIGLSSKFASADRFSAIVLACPAVWGLTIPRFCAESILQVGQLSMAAVIAAGIGCLPSKLFGLGTVNHSSRYFTSFLEMARNSSIASKFGARNLHSTGFNSALNYQVTMYEYTP